MVKKHFHLLMVATMAVFFLAGCSFLVGDPGSDGADGTNGTNGVDGTNGTNGVDGTNGTNGVDGTNGTNGVDGTNGTNGVDGTNGTNGVDGTNGTNGVDGTNGTNGVDGTNGTNGTDGANTGVLGAYFYLEDINNSEVKINYGDPILLIYSTTPQVDRRTATMTIINNSWTPLTLSGTPTIEDLGGWYLDNPSGTRIYGAVPSISITPPAASVVDLVNTVFFNVVFAPVDLPQDSRSRKRYRIALQDAEGTNYSFDFEVDAVVYS